MFITRASKLYAERLRDGVSDLLTRQCGVELSREENRITPVRNGFNFLGFRLQLGVGQTGK